MILDNYRIPVPQMPGIVRRQVVDRSSKKSHIDVSFTVNYSPNPSGTFSPKRKTIGRICEDNQKFMHPSDQYRLIFPAEWEKITGEKAPALEKDVGFYVGVKAICERLNLLAIMEKSFGADKTKAILDYAMFSILKESNATENFVNAMEDEVLFSDEPREDTYYSDLFNKKISGNDLLTFKKQWALQCKTDGVEEVWLCIDGSNDDCTSRGVELAEHGHAKSKKNINIVSYTYAVTTDGKPVTFEVYRGGLVDAKAMKAIIAFLQECGLSLRGVILDRGYCDSTALSYLHNAGISYVIMIKGNPAGYASVVLEYGEQIKMNSDYWIEGTHLFAAQKQVKLYDNLQWEDYATVFYDFDNGDQRVKTLLANVSKETLRLRTAIENGNKATPKSSLSKIISVDNEAQTVSVDREQLQEAIDEKGLYGLVSSEKLTVSDLHQLYSSRTESEIQYRITKTFLGYGTMKIHLTKGVHSKFCCAFIASIIRQEIRNAAAKIDLTAKQGIRELDFINIRNVSGTWYHDEAEVKREYTVVANLLGGDSDGKAYVQKTVAEINERKKIKGFRHKKAGRKKASLSVAVNEQGERVKQKPGPKPGYKRGEFNKDGTPRKTPGPKPGTKRGMYNKDGSIRKQPGPKPGKKAGLLNSADG